MSNITTFNEIDQHKNFYLHKILTSKEDDTINFIKYEYCPYLLMKTNIHTYDYESNYILKLLDFGSDYNSYVMIRISQLLTYINNKNKIFKIKGFISTLISEIPDNYKYKDILKNHYINIFKSIRDAQKEHKLLESAMLNYSPIVQYKGTIRKESIESVNISPDNQSIMIQLIDVFKKYSTRKDLFDNYINEFLITNIIDIISGYDYCIKISEPTTYEDIDSDIIANIMKNDNTINKNAKFYYTLVYFAFLYDESKYKDLSKHLSSLYLIKNKLENGDTIDVGTAVECFMNLPTFFV